MGADLSEAEQAAALAEIEAAISEGRESHAIEIVAAMREGGTVSDIAGELQEGNPDEELAAAIEELEPAAGEVADAALDAGRPDLAAEVVGKTLETLADWAESAEELAETLEEVADEIGNEGAQEVADKAADAAGEAAAEVAETLETAGVEPEVADMLTEPAEEPAMIADVAPEASHWLMRRRFRSGV